MNRIHHSDAPPTGRDPDLREARIELAGVDVVRGDRLVLRDVSLTVTPAARIALVGENGRGKTTLLHMLAGRLDPDRGTATRQGRIGLAEQEVDLRAHRTVGELTEFAVAASRAALARLDEAAAGLGADAAADHRYAQALARAERLDAWDAERRVRVALEALGAETDPNRPLAELSVGQRARVRLACLIGGDDELLLLDEPTNHRDRSGLEFLTARLRDRRGGVVLVSHDRALLADVAETFVDLDPARDGRPRVFGGGIERYRQLRDAERASWERDHAAQEQERKRLEAALESAQERLRDGWRPPKGTGKHARSTRADGIAQSVHRRRQALAAAATEVPEPPLELHWPELAPPEGELLVASGVRFDGRLDRPVDVALEAGSRLVVTGPNGAGKTTLLAMLAGDLAPSSGEVRHLPGARIQLLRQESPLPLERRVDELFEALVDVQLARGLIADDEALELESLGLLAERERALRVGELSIGQRRRLDLALLLTTRPDVLLLDEPTNHLSMPLVDALTEALATTPAAVVLVTHDRQLLRDTAGWERLELG
ncbi:MAG: ABC-F family ATP-binding cassette domain-containing protein [Microbacteriaceae bacterium]|nr:ABC-F family ATP-binding cassette domain-containing protein [Microbacteriaceae bacterium]